MVGSILEKYLPKHLLSIKLMKLTRKWLIEKQLSHILKLVIKENKMASWSEEELVAFKEAQTLQNRPY